MVARAAGGGGGRQCRSMTSDVPVNRAAGLRGGGGGGLARPRTMVIDKEGAIKLQNDGRDTITIKLQFFRPALGLGPRAGRGRCSLCRRLSVREAFSLITKRNFREKRKEKRKKEVSFFFSLRISGLGPKEMFLFSFRYKIHAYIASPCILSAESL